MSATANAKSEKSGVYVLTCTLCLFALPFAFLFLYYPVSEWLSYQESRPGFDAIYEKEILPGAAWVTQYFELHGKLPTQEEYRTSRKLADEYWGTGLKTEATAPNFDIKGNNFMIYTSAGSWNLFYQSWDGKRWWLYNE